MSLFKGETPHMKKSKSFFAVISLAALLSISACSGLLPSSREKSGNSINQSVDQGTSAKESSSEIYLPEAFKIYQLYLAEGGKLSYEEWLATVRGEKGETGDKGDKGDAGKSAYEKYKEAHPEYNKTEEEWLDDLLNGHLGIQIAHTVSFNTNGGSEVDNQTVKHGEKVNKPADPTKDGYTFEGWYYQNEPWSFVGYVVTEDMVIEAKWKAIDYTATFFNDDGTVLDNQENVHYGDQLTYNGETPVKPNPEDHYVYTFKGWDKELTVNGDMAFTAQYDKEFAPYEEKYLNEEGEVIYSRYLTEDSSRKIIHNNKELEEIDGQYYLEAENAIRSDGVSVVYGSGHGGAAIGSPNVGRYLRYQFTVSESLSAVITAAVSNTYNRFNELFSIVVNGKEIEISDDATHPGTYLWDDYQEGIVGKVSFKKGLNELIVNFNYDYFNMDYIGIRNCALDLSQEGVENPTKANDDNYKYQFRGWEKQDQVDSVINYVPIFAKATKGLEFVNQKVDVYHGSAKDVVVPEWWDGFVITTIASNSFARTEIETVTLPDSITLIDERAFNYCEQLTTINLPFSLTRIAGAAFEGCKSLVNASLNEGLVEIDYYAFFETKLKEIIIPSTVTLIQNDAFKYVQADFCYIPATCQNIQSYAFGTEDSRTMTVLCEREYRPSTFSSDWVKNNTVVWGYKSMVEENGYKFALSEIEGEKGLIFVGFDSSIENVEIPNSVNDIPVTSVSGGAFAGNKTIKTVVLPNCVTQINERMFFQCDNLEGVTIPDSVTSIGRYAFANCSRLKSIVMPNSVKECGDHLFENCVKLESVTLSTGLKVISEAMFKECDSLSFIEIPEGVESTQFGIVESADNVKSIVFPSTLKSLANQTFFYNWGIDNFYLKISPEAWNAILETYINDYDGIDRPTVYYYSEEAPTEAGNYWHYVDGVPTVW